MKKGIFKAATVVFALLLLLTAVVPLSVFAEEDKGGTQPAQSYSQSDVVKSSVTAYDALSNYGGASFYTYLKAEDLIDLKVTGHGGITTDGEGRLVFKNYATLSIAVKTEDSSMMFAGTNTRLLSDRRYKYNAQHIGGSALSIIELDTMIGYGVILTSRENANGTREVDEEMYIRNYDDRADGIRITEDGNYHVVILMKVSEDGIYKKLAVEYEIPIRTNVYLTDKSGDYHVKDAGAYYDSVRIDALGRPGVDIRVDGMSVQDGHIISGVGRYEITVEAAGFLCEKFTYEIFSTDQSHARVYLSNVRSRIDDISYECENSFKVNWYSAYAATMSYWANGEPDKVNTYTAGTVISDPGYYVFTLNIPGLANEQETFLVRLVADDSPAHNLEILSGNRFNNFKTKWIEVYDDEAGLYYCFATNETVKAMDAAMTVERKSLTEYGHYSLYRDVKYTDRAELTAAMTAAAAANMRIVYYEPDGERIEKYFSDRAFDGTVYLNSDFIFARVSPAESDKVYLTDSEGNVTNIDFFVPVSAYGLKSGVYTVTEEDRYGNRTEYKVTVDAERPTLSFSAAGETLTARDKEVYSARYFSDFTLTDSLDAYALMAVTKDGADTEYFLSGEAVDAAITEAGIYKIRVYDRNGNSFDFTLKVEGERQWTLARGADGAVTVSLVGADTAITAVYVDGEESAFDLGARTLSFASADEARRVTVYTEDKVSGERDCVSFVVEALATEDTDNGTGDTDAGNTDSEEGGMTLDLATIIILIVLILSLAGAAVVIVIIWRRR